VEKYYRTGQATDGNLARAHCMLDTQSYKHTLGVSNNYCFSIITMFARTPVQTHVYTPGTYCAESGIVAVLSPGKAYFPCVYHSASGPYSLI
jgi:hypothetical protein